MNPKDTAQFELEKANALYEAGRVNEALSVLEALLKKCPQFADGHYQRGILHKRLGDAPAALESFMQAVACRPDFANAWYRAGNVWYELGQFEKASQLYEQALQLAPDVAVFQFNHGAVLRKLNRNDDALVCYDRALALRPDYPEAHCNRGNLLFLRQRYRDAADAYSNAIALKGDLVQALEGLGRTLVMAKQPERAMPFLERAMMLAPERGETLFAMGQALRNLGRSDQALLALRKAQMAGYESADVYVEIGLSLCDAGRYEEALAHYREALELVAPPFRFGIRRNFGLLLLGLGRYSEGWPLYEARMESADHIKRLLNRCFPCETPWQGTSSLKNKTLLVLDEQGLGDSLQFLRFLPQLQALGCRLVVEIKDTLLPILNTGMSGVKFITTDTTLPPFDEYVCLMSLPFVLRSTLATLPTEGDLWRVPPEIRQRWSERLGPGKRRRIGLAWAGNPNHANDLHRSIPLVEFGPLLALDYEFHSVQKDLRPGDLALLDQHRALHQHQNELHDLAETGALLHELELLITVDTAMAHLAGVLGIPCWLLLAFSPDFRWLFERSDSPWYASIRIFRQPRIADWHSVIAAVCDALKP